PSVQEFVRAMSTSEEDQLRAFLGFVQGKGLIPALRARDWKTFARVYNGPNYQVNNYDVRLEKAYRAAGGVQS
ncbi:MAG: peptidoglycan-binding protein, partial [Spirochaetae bacterium HGW-Spirochaetae-10]